MAATGRAIRLVNFGIRLLQLFASVIIFAIFSYFLAIRAAPNTNRYGEWHKAVTGISGAATFYTLLASGFTLSIGGVPFFSFLAVMLDLCFAIGFLAICIMTRHGVQSCSGRVETPIGDGYTTVPGEAHGERYPPRRDDPHTYMPDLATACRLEKVVFIVSIIGVFLFLLAIPAQRKYTKYHQHTKNITGNVPAKRTSTRFGNRLWPSRTSQAPTKGLTGIEYSKGNTSTGVIPLENRRDIDKAPGYTSISQPLTTNSNVNAYPEHNYLQPGGQGRGNNLAGFNPSYEYGKRAYTVGSPQPPLSPTSTENTNPWRSDYAEYAYGQSGTESYEYAHGYGNTLYKK
ncbi:uncharacterized protein GIQ15_03768 [Arthroderma uncinatum]|uniref:uncharacterized protein n=1 Tax=Arthroderma uncinatum TaxID=74035 RepID=UPI00144A6018|nr:uncharacterized protein GIQ15_03768 [Arthroderma uncinatum]KAF3484444.1 hypothetical protein GIQ15_03768 [Arthroderma uncinatum]